MPREVCSSVVDALHHMKRWINPIWLENLLFGTLSAMLSNPDAPPGNSFLDEAVMLGLADPLVNGLFDFDECNQDASLVKYGDSSDNVVDSDNWVSDYPEEGALSSFFMDASFCAFSFGSCNIDDVFANFVNCKYSPDRKSCDRSSNLKSSDRDRKRFSRILLWLRSRCRDASVAATLRSEDLINALAHSPALALEGLSCLSVSWKDVAVKIFCAHERLQKDFSFLDETSIVEQATFILATFADGKYANLFNFLFVPSSVFLRWLIRQFLFPILSLDEILILVREEAETFHFESSSQRLMPWHPSAVAAASLLVAAVEASLAAGGGRGAEEEGAGRGVAAALRAAGASGLHLEIAGRIRQTVCKASASGSPNNY
jgi:hypothetical protein